MRRAAILISIAIGLAGCGGDKTTNSNRGDSALPGDPGQQGDELPGDPGTGDPGGGDRGGPTVITPSTQFCAAGGKVSSSSYRGTVCLSPLGSGGQVSTSFSYKWIPGPAHIVEAE